MDHREALDQILEHSCFNYGPAGKSFSWNRYELDLHCDTAVIIARPVGSGRYEIYSVTFAEDERGAGRDMRPGTPTSDRDLNDQIRRVELALRAGRYGVEG